MVEYPVNDPNRPVAFFLLSALLGLFWRQKSVDFDCDSVRCLDGQFISLEHVAAV